MRQYGWCWLRETMLMPVAVAGNNRHRVLALILNQTYKPYDIVLFLNKTRKLRTMCVNMDGVGFEKQR